MISCEDLKTIYFSYIKSKYSKNKAKLFFISDSYFKEFCEKYEKSEKFRDDVLIHTRSYKYRKLMKSIEKR